MSFLHKAFLFDWPQFEAELAPLLARSLAEGGTESLIAFGNQYLELLRDPYEGRPLPVDWAAQFEVGDVQKVADFVLTKYYDPMDAAGVGEGWLSLEQFLPEEARLALLGAPFGPQNAYFDPGRMGAYFQDAETASDSLAALKSMAADPSLGTYIGLLRRAVTEGKGVYVTF